MKTVTYIGPFDEVEVPALGRTVKRGEPVEVDPEVAGKLPSGKPGTKGYDPGDGLLAQTDNWKTTSTRKTAPAPRAGRRGRAGAPSHGLPPVTTSPGAEGTGLESSETSETSDK